MDFDLSEDQRLLVDTIASFVKKESPVARLRGLRQDPLGWSRPVWRRMGEQGWLGVAFPESVGGSGGSFVDAALILEQLGAALVPEPYLPLLVAGTALARLASPAQLERWLAPAVAGSASLALAASEAGSRYDAARVSTRATPEGDRYRISGEKRWVQNGHAADHLVVPARTAGADGDAGGISLFVLHPADPGVKLRPVATMDGHHAAMLTLDGVLVGAERRLGPEGEAGPVLAEALDVGAAAACAEGHGVIRAALWMTVEYLRTREQFGVKIGTFQALQHRAVDMFVETELCRSMSMLAMIAVGDPDVAARRSAISAAKVQLAAGGAFVTRQAIQLHGGIGVTDEHDIGLYFKRMQVLNSLFGDEEHHLDRFAALPGFTAGI